MKIYSSIKIGDEKQQRMYSVYRIDHQRLVKQDVGHKPVGRRSVGSPGRVGYNKNE